MRKLVAALSTVHLVREVLPILGLVHGATAAASCRSLDGCSSLRLGALVWAGMRMVYSIVRVDRFRS